jgi:hemolysin activation/secretion protein
MRSRVWVLAALALVSFMTPAANAQVIPPSDQPGRQRERFIQPPTAQSQPAGPVVTLPSTIAPKGAEEVFLLVRGVKITGSTVYQPKDFTPFYKNLVGQRVSLAAVHALAQAITTKYGNDG